MAPIMGSPLENIPVIRVDLSSRRFALFAPKDEEQTARLRGQGYVEKQSGYFLRPDRSKEYDELASTYTAIRVKPDFYAEKGFKPQWKYTLFREDPFSRDRKSKEVAGECSIISKETKREIEVFTVRDGDDQKYSITVSNLPAGVYTEEQIADLVKVVASINRALPERKKIRELSFSKEDCGGTYHGGEKMSLPVDRMPYDLLVHTVVHEIGHAVFDTLDQDQVERWNQLWQYSLGENSSEIFDDSNYGDWPDTMGHPTEVSFIPNRGRLGTELFASAFAAILLHPDQVKLFMEHSSTTPSMKLLGQAAITELALLGYVDMAGPLHSYRGDTDGLLVRVREKIPTHILQAMKLNGSSTIFSVDSAIHHYPRAEYAPELVRQFRSQELFLEDPKHYDNDFHRALCAQRADILGRLINVYSVAPEELAKLLSNDEVYQYALETPSLDKPIEYLLISHDPRVAEFLRSSKMTTRNTVAETILEKGNSEQRRLLFPLVEDDNVEIRSIAYKAILREMDRSLPLTDSQDLRYPVIHKVMEKWLVSIDPTDNEYASAILQVFPHPSFFIPVMNTLSGMEDGRGVDGDKDIALANVLMSIQRQFNSDPTVTQAIEQFKKDEAEGKIKITNSHAREIIFGP
ncbi:MAG: hypothetical protein Q7S68_03665 [Deltaproteobacteria bacterium]|nr:hypothetical protein [Deltaproteobacteria bacterium]